MKNPGTTQSFNSVILKNTIKKPHQNDHIGLNLPLAMQSKYRSLIWMLAVKVLCDWSEIEEAFFIYI